jgi:hypothetical protein
VEEERESLSVPLRCFHDPHAGGSSKSGPLGHGGTGDRLDRRMAGMALPGIFHPPSAGRGGILGVGRNPWLVDARYRTYMQFYWSLGKGMSREEVMAMLEKAYPPTGPRIRPRIIEDSGTRLGFHMNPENQPQPDHEAIYLKLEAGKVMGKSYERN